MWLTDCRGVTLLEMVIAVMILGIMTLTLFRVFTFATVQNRRTAQLDELYSIAQRGMEYIKDHKQVADSASFAVLTDYTSVAETRSRFVVTYRARKNTLQNPDGTSGAPADAPSSGVNYRIEVEVYYASDTGALGPPGTQSKVGSAGSLKIPIASLTSQLTQFE